MNDIKFKIAVGKSRTQKVWKNQDFTWLDLLNRFENTHRTIETIAEYSKMPKSKQDNIKDVGGFVGGYCKDGSRSNVQYRQIIALDIDFGGLELWDEWLLTYGNTACMYSTHKHKPDNPRLRLIIPLLNKVGLDEYQAIARRIAGELGIDAFDDTTFQPQRLMYWPSTSKDGEYVFETFEGDFLDPDEVLSTYEDWSDITLWPVSSRGEDAIRKGISKQKDPLSKKGMVGAFCRAYTIHEAIDTFVEDYEPCDIENRYTYLKGSTSAGIITYNDMFSYSHHGTDPASSVLCNAFDLVRLHKFKDLDEGASSDTPSTRLPSYKAMEDFAVNDKKVKIEIIQARQEIVDSFDVETSDDKPKESTDWIDKLDVLKSGQVVPSYKNIQLVMCNDKNLKGKFGFNDLSKSLCLLGSVPWRKYNPRNCNLTDVDDANLRIYIENRYGIQAKEKIYDVVNQISHKNTFHPIKDYLEKLEWDGVDRLETLFIDYFGVEDSEYSRAVTRKTLIAAVARVYEPGCHFDTMLTLKGTQGCGKSSFFRKLSKGWFSDSIKDIKSKDTLENLQGVWFVEMGELTAMKKVDAETIKSFLSGTVDRFRLAYGRRTQDFPRQCIFVGTTNESGFLRDKTGNRRFWILSASKTKKANKDVFKISKHDIDQIWAETKIRYDIGEDLFLDEVLEKQAVIEQESYIVEDPKEALILEYLERKLPTNWDALDIYDRQEWLASKEVGTVERTKVCSAEIWCEALGYSNIKKLDSYQITEINKIVDKLYNWEKQKNPIRFKIYGPKRGYYKVNED